ncbi:MAG: transcriptional regulator GcvA [Parvibaculaceae bacterium]
MVCNRRLPQMNGIRAFEAAARHLSFTRAAEELSVTQAAVSQQIKALENRLNVMLFRRVNNQLFLTDAGQAWLPKLMRAFDLLESGIEGLRAYDNGGTLTCRVPSSFSVQWLAPRLARFHVSHPAVDIRLLAMGWTDKSGEQDADIQVQNGAGMWPDVECLLLMRERVFPVCSPALLERPGGIPTIESLERQTLLHVSGYRESWERWFAAAGQSGLPVKPGLHFDQSVTAIHAAINGFGVALGRSALVAGEIAAGRLVPLFNIKLTAEDAYWITYRKERAKRPNVQAFRDWLLAEAAAAQG